MRIRDVDAALAAANPVGRARVAELPAWAGERELFDAVRAEALPDQLSGSRRTASRVSARLAIAALLCLAVLAAAAFTAPGRAVTSWVGEKVGFGEPGGEPTLRQLRAAWTKGSGAEGQPAHVLVVGPAPHDTRYEFIAYRTKEEPGKRWPANGGLCFELDLTQLRNSGTQGCGILPKGRDVYFFGLAGNSDPDQEVHYLTGRASTAVSSIEARFDGKPVDVELAPIPTELVQRLGLGRPFQFFIAFFDGASHGGQITATARDAAGEVVGRFKSRISNPASLYMFMCKDLRQRAHANPAALEDCDSVLGPSGR